MGNFFSSCYPIGIFIEPKPCEDKSHKSQKSPDPKNFKNNPELFDVSGQIDIECTICHKIVAYCHSCKKPDKFICRHINRKCCDLYEQQVSREIRQIERFRHSAQIMEDSKKYCDICKMRTIFAERFKIPQEVLSYSLGEKYPCISGGKKSQHNFSTSVCDYCYSTGKICRGCLMTHKKDVINNYCSDCDIRKCRYCGKRDRSLPVKFESKYSTTKYCVCTDCVNKHICCVRDSEGKECLDEKFPGLKTCVKHKHAHLDLCVFCKINEAQTYYTVCEVCAKKNLPKRCSMCQKTERECDLTSNTRIDYLRPKICNKCYHFHLNETCEAKVATHYEQTKKTYIMSTTTTTRYSNGFSGLPINTYEESSPLIDTKKKDIFCNCTEPYSEERTICYHTFTSQDYTGYRKEC